MSMGEIIKMSDVLSGNFHWPDKYFTEKFTDDDRKQMRVIPHMTLVV
jgi:hypothetical protein